MAVDKPPSTANPARTDTVAAGRHLVRTACKGALATLDRESGHPYVSLVLTATEPDGTPLFLLSSLARHGKNLQGDGRASLLLDGTGDSAEPLTGNRLTLMGDIRSAESPTARRRFLARHQSAADYVDFADFAFYTLRVTGAHFIGGFGRIFSIAPAELLTTTEGAEKLIEAEPEIIEHMNADHADALSLYASELAGFGAGAWRMTGIDPEGVDLLHRTNAARIAFAKRIHTPAEARAALVALAQKARTTSGGRT
jgi:heme iron utilization protein